MFKKDLRNKTFTRLTVQAFAGNNKHGQTLWKCKCKCGNTTTVTVGALTSGCTRSCGCLQRKFISALGRKGLNNLKGKGFGRLKAVRRSHNDDRGQVYWECMCTCGTRVRVVANSLTSGTTKSCGCLKTELLKASGRKRTTHGQSRRGKRTPEYQACIDAKQRCTNPNNSKYEDYGGRGIRFTFTSFEQFFAELGPRPKGKSLDRIHNDGNYQPGNVQWATQEEQHANRRSTKKPCQSVKDIRKRAA